MDTILEFVRCATVEQCIHKIKDECLIRQYLSSTGGQLGASDAARVTFSNDRK